MNITWLIDMGYVTKASKGRFKLDYIACKKHIEQTLKASCKAMIFNSVDGYGVDFGLNQFYYTVKQAGFIVNLYKMEGGSQKQVDVAIASYMVHDALKGNLIVLSSGDIDFLPAMQLVTASTQSKPILFTFDFGVHEELIAASSEHWLFEDHPQLMR
jgi:uncharacterized LabA/DUF88 family protein